MADTDEVSEIELDGPGPFILPICDSTIDLSIGEMFAVLVVRTLDDKEVQIPFGLAVLGELQRMSGEALRILAAHEGETRQ